jgi:hypothetical protein
MEGADDNDEFLTMEAIEQELQEMEDLNSELPTEEGSGSGAYHELVEMRNKLDEMIKNLGVSEQKIMVAHKFCRP